MLLPRGLYLTYFALSRVIPYSSIHNGIKWEFSVYLLRVLSICLVPHYLSSVYSHTIYSQPERIIKIMDISQIDVNFIQVSFHGNEIKRELESLKEILKKTAENPSVITKNLTEVKNSQITNKTNYLTKFLKTCHEYPDIFTIFAKKSIDHDIFIKIPETLLYSSHGKNPIFLFNCPEGYICADSSESSISSFFSLVEKRSQQNLNNSPLFIHKSKGGGDHLYFNSQIARTEFEECPYRYHMLQRYLRVGSKSAWKVCVDWMEGSIKYYTLVNNCNFTKENSFKDLKPKPKPFEPKQDNQRFLINSKDYKSYHIVASLQPIQTLSSIVKKAIPVINKLIYNTKPVNEIIVDFIKDFTNEWIFIGVQGCILKGKPAGSASNKKNIIPLKPNLTGYPTISFTREKSSSSIEELTENTLSKVESRRISKISRKIFRKATTVQAPKLSDPPKVAFMTKEEEFNFYLKQKSSDSLGRIPFNMIGILPQNLGNHLTYFVEDKKEMMPRSMNQSGGPFGFYLDKGKSVKSSIEYLNKISEELDNKRSQVFNLRSRLKSASILSKTSDYSQD